MAEGRGARAVDLHVPSGNRGCDDAIIGAWLNRQQERGKAPRRDSRQASSTTETSRAGTDTGSVSDADDYLAEYARSTYDVETWLGVEVLEIPSRRVR